MKVNKHVLVHVNVGLLMCVLGRSGDYVCRSASDIVIKYRRCASEIIKKRACTSPNLFHGFYIGIE